MKGYNNVLSFLFLLVLSNNLLAQEFTTYTYFTNDSVELVLDLFLPQTKDNKLVPLVLYVHGGGFSSGSRQNGHVLAKYLQNNGIACASISYTLYMKGKNFGCNGILSEKKMAIQLASNQIWQATSYVLNHAVEMGVNPNQLFLAGSSAGAEAVMHASYYDRDKMQLYTNSLPEDFRYMGVISGAGALLDIDLITANNAIPLLAFHGDKDKLVPYATAPHHYCSAKSPGYMMFYGSSTIAQKLQHLGVSVELITFQGGGHAFCGELFFKNQAPIVGFISRVAAGERFEIFETVKVASK